MKVDAHFGKCFVFTPGFSEISKVAPGTTAAQTARIERGCKFIPDLRMGPFGLTLPELPPLPQGNLKASTDSTPLLHSLPFRKFVLLSTSLFFQLLMHSHATSSSWQAIADGKPAPAPPPKGSAGPRLGDIHHLSCWSQLLVRVEAIRSEYVSLIRKGAQLAGRQKPHHR